MSINFKQTNIFGNDVIFSEEINLFYKEKYMKKIDTFLIGYGFSLPPIANFLYESDFREISEELSKINYTTECCSHGYFYNGEESELLLEYSFFGNIIQKKTFSSPTLKVGMVNFDCKIESSKKSEMSKNGISVPEDYDFINIEIYAPIKLSEL